MLQSIIIYFNKSWMVSFEFYIGYKVYLFLIGWLPGAIHNHFQIQSNFEVSSDDPSSAPGALF